MIEPESNISLYWTLDAKFDKEVKDNGREKDNLFNLRHDT